MNRALPNAGSEEGILVHPLHDSTCSLGINPQADSEIAINIQGVSRSHIQVEQTDISLIQAYTRTSSKGHVLKGQIIAKWTQVTVGMETVQRPMD